ncbi:hypothetical protein CWN85_15390 [Vibrio splendidus]|nr:hypothetical protein CWN86_15635 [Vibrio splendidus]PTP22288.1 hypothetical protein CWN85_15390 [Vibrio splendidus]
MKRPFLVASDLRPCMPVDETQRKNGDSTDWDRMDVILRAYRYAMIPAERKGDILERVKQSHLNLRWLIVFNTTRENITVVVLPN